MMRTLSPGFLLILIGCTSPGTGPVFTCPEVFADAEDPASSLCYFAPNTPPDAALAAVAADPDFCVLQRSEICNGEYDCWDGQDETACPGFRYPSMECGATSCSCSAGGTIDSEEYCDGLIDCRDGQDEAPGCQPRPSSSSPSSPSHSGSASGGDDGYSENRACYDCFNGYCTVYYAKECY